MTEGHQRWAGNSDVEMSLHQQAGDLAFCLAMSCTAGPVPHAARLNGVFVDWVYGTQNVGHPTAGRQSPSGVFAARYLCDMQGFR